MDGNGTDNSFEEKCEYLMNTVVETRKQFKKRCIDYDQKTVFLENKMLKHHIDFISSCNLKKKRNIKMPEINRDEIKDLEEFNNQILLSQKRFDELRQNVLNMQTIVLQMKTEPVGQKLKSQLTAKAILAEAKQKNNK